MNVAAIAIAGGAALVASISGAGAALTTIPPLVLCATSVGLILIAAREAGSGEQGSGRAGVAVWAIAGGLLGVALPTAAPPAPGRIVTHAPVTAIRSDLFDVLDALDRDPNTLVGRTVSVTGEWTPQTVVSSAAVSRRIMSCCAADAVAVGFDVELARATTARAGSPVRVTGTVAARMRDGELRYVLERSTATALEDPAR